ncbi:MAG: helix-hairpin-helix domain-containing protein, partial [Holophagales bacterium]|nr:helix-hairpin-helix domain-containing protein [Holophagales bacterium]
PGVGPVTIEALRASGVESYADLLATSAEELQEVDGVGPKTAQALLEWASGKLSGEEPVIEEVVEEEVVESEGDPPSLGNDEFMAALSRALAESEEQRASSEGEELGFESESHESTPSGDEAIADSAAKSEDRGVEAT